eukprot:m.411246 g.411246  ORF g.411246 m.411246 type:complete len:2678 (-) comp20163_c1_seq6:250-8283(-)
MAAGGAGTAERRFLRSGDFVSLYCEGASQNNSGYTVVESFSSDSLHVFFGQNVPNFQQSCVFQVRLVSDDGNDGDIIHFGDLVTLVHRGTQKAIARRAAQTERGRFGAVLQDDVRTEKAHFRPMPRFKLHSEGDPVGINDQALIQCSQDTQNLYLHVDKTGNAHADSATISVATSKTTGFRFKLFAPFNVSSDAFRHVLKGGDFVRIFHQESNSFLVAHDMHDEAESSNVAARAIPEDKETTEFHDASSLWQVELLKSDLRGGRPVEWTDLLRLKSVLTDKFLDSNTNTMLGSGATDSSHFRFVRSAVTGDQEDTAIPFNNFLYIHGDEPQESASWFHVVQDHRLDEDEEEENEAVTHIECRFDVHREEDALMILPVELSDIHKFYTASSQLRVLRDLRDVEPTSLSTSSSTFLKCREALYELIRFSTKDDPDVPPMEHDGEPLILHQNMLLDLHVDSLLVHFVSKPFDKASSCARWAKGYSGAHQHTLTAFNELARCIYRLFRQMCKSNGHAGYRLARFKTDITNQCKLVGQLDDVDWHIAEALEEMFRDNEILLRSVDGSYVSVFVNMITQSHTYDNMEQLVELLGSFCSHDGEALPEVQDAVRHQLIEAEDLIPHTHLVNGHVMIRGRHEQPGKPFKEWPIEELPIEEYLVKDDHVRYFAAILDLLSAICLDRRHDSQVELRGPEFAPFEEVLCVMDNAKVHPRVRAAYCKLCVHLYVDSDPVTERETLRNRQLRDIRGTRQDKHHIELLNRVIDSRVLLDWVDSFLKAHHTKKATLISLQADAAYHKALHGKKGKKALSTQDQARLLAATHAEETANHFAVEVLFLIDTLAKFGFYHEAKRRHRIAGILLDILWRAHASSESAYSDSAAHRVVMKAKREICSILSKFLTTTINEDLSDLLATFKDELEHKGNHKHLDHHADGRLRQLRMFHNDAAFKWFHQHRFSDDMFVWLMLDLAEYPDDSLRIAALDLLTRSFTMKTELLEEMKQVTIIASANEAQVMEEIQTKLEELQVDEHEELHVSAPHMTGVLKWFSEQCVKADPKQPRQGPLWWWEKHLPANHLHQDLIRNEHVHRHVIKVLHEYLQAHSADAIAHELSEPAIRELFTMCFRFLTVFVAHNTKNQADLCHTREEMNFLVHACQHGIHGEVLLANLLDGNEVASHEYLDEHLIHLLVGYLFSSEQCRTASYLRLLHKVVAPNGHGERERQGPVVEQIFEHGAAVPEVLYKSLDTGAVLNNGAWLTDLAEFYSLDREPTERETQSHEFFLELVRLFTVCVDGNNAETATVIATEAPMSHLIPLTEPSLRVPYEEKVAFVTFLNEVHFPILEAEEMVTSKTMPSASAEDLSADFGFGDSRTADKVDACGQLAGIFAAEFAEVARVLHVDAHRTRHILDHYVLDCALPFVKCLFQHAAKEIFNETPDTAEAVATMIAQCQELSRSLLHLLDARKELDASNPQFLLSHVSRLAGAQNIHDLMGLADVDALSERVFEPRTAKKLSEYYSYFHGEDELSGLRSMQGTHKHHHTSKHKSHKSHKHGTKGGTGHHHHHQHNSRKIPFLSASRHKHGTAAGTASRLLLPEDEEEGNEDENDQVADELRNFTDQVREAFRKGHEPHMISWLTRLADRGTDLDFAEFWDLVHLIRTELVTHQHQMQGVAETSRDKGGFLKAFGTRRRRTSRIGAAKDDIALEELDEHSGTAFEFDIDQSFLQICKHFRNHDDEDGAHHLNPHDVEAMERMVITWLRVISALASPESTEELAIQEQRSVVLRLNSLELPETLVYLMTSHHQETVETAAILAGLLLHGSPFENASDNHPQFDHPHSQVQFAKAIRSEHYGKRFLHALRRIFENHKEHLHKREHELEADKAKRDQDAEDLEARVVIGILEVLRLCCAGMYEPLQEWFRHQEQQAEQINVLAMVVELSHSFLKIYLVKERDGFDFEDLTRKSAVTDRLNELRRERDDTVSLIHLYECLTEMISGPNRANQRVLVDHKVCDPMLQFLSYMEKDTNGIDQYVEDVQASLDQWMDAWEVEEDEDGNCVESDESEVTVSNKIKDDLKHCWLLLDELRQVDEDVEAAILTCLLGLMEGRKHGDDIFDLLCHYLFERGSSSGDVVFFNMNKHFSAAKESELSLDEELEKVSALDEDATHHLDSEVFFLYYSIIRVLAEESRTFGKKLGSKLHTWEVENHANMKERVGRIEIVRNGELETVLFPIPHLVHDIQHKPIVDELKEEIMDSTIMMDPQQKVISFWDESETLQELFFWQARIMTHPHLRLLTEERQITWLAFACAVFINIWVIFDLEDEGVAEAIPTIVGYIHLALALFMLAGYGLNRFPIDWKRFKASDVWRDGGLWRPLKSVGYWCTHSRVLYLIFYIVFSIMGLSLSLKWFAFHLFDIVFRVQVMGLVMQAVQQNLMKLMATFVLAFLLLYAFSLIGQAGFSGEYGFSDANLDTANLECKADSPVLGCLRDHLYYGFMGSPVFTDPMTNVGAFVFSLLYFITVVLIMTSIVAGIIIDSFSELRAASEQIQAEKANRCYICSHTRDELERASKTGFSGHFKLDHHCWTYVYFRIHLTIKEQRQGSLSGPEVYFLREQRADRGPDLIPVNRAVCLELAGQHKETEMEHLRDQVDALVKSQQTLDSKLTAVTEMLATVVQSVSGGGAAGPAAGASTVLQADA